MKKVLFAICFCIIQSIAFSQSVFYVTPSGAGLKNGLTWSNAIDSSGIQNAINVLSNNGGGQLWIAKGVYYPNQDVMGSTLVSQSRFFTFTLRQNVKVFGGFAGYETSIYQRAKNDQNANGQIETWEYTNETVLSGDVDRNGQMINNSYHVVSDILGNVNNMEINGFTIKYGNANVTDTTSYQSLGAGLIVKNALVKNCKITQNTAYGIGGGVVITEDAIVDSCFVYQNTCGGYGAGVAINEVGILKNSVIFSNFGGMSGGVLCNAGGEVISCAIVSNTSEYGNGGVFLNNGGFLVNSLIFNNQSIGTFYPGAKNIASGVSNLNGNIISCSIANNLSPDGISVVANGYIINSLIADKIKKGDFFADSKVYNNITTDILSSKNITLSDISKFGFIKPTTFKGAATTNNTIYELNFVNWAINGTSPAINAGTENITALNLPVNDVYGNKRVQYERIDVGAMEFAFTRYITVNGSGLKNGSSWANAFPKDKLQDAINLGIGDVWIAGGIYDLSSTLLLNSNVRVVGGFSGTEISLDQRKLFDKDGDGVINRWEFQNETRLISNAQVDLTDYLIDGSNANNKTVVDGITISACEGKTTILHGGAMYFRYGSVLNCSIINNTCSDSLGAFVASYNSRIAYCFISGNKSIYGGGITVFNKSTVSHCLITHNTSQLLGGGIYINSGTLEKSIITQNRNIGGMNKNGGGVNIISGLIDNCLVANNVSEGYGTRGGGIYAYANLNTVIIKNTTVVHNKVDGVDTQSPDLAVKCAVTMTNSIIGSPIYFQGLTLNNKIENSAIVGGYTGLGAGSGIIAVSDQAELDKQFDIPSPQTGLLNTSLYPYSWKLNVHSLFLNKGKNEILPVDSIVTDITDMPRIQHDTIDLGAYEYKIIEPVATKFGLKLQTQTSKDSVILSWNKVPVNHYTIFVKEGSSGIALTQNGKTYIPNVKMGVGSYLDGWYCVYDGTDTFAVVKGLLQGTIYKAMLVPNNGYQFRLYNSYAVENDNISFFITKREQTIQLNLPDTIQGATDLIANVSTTSGLGVQLTSSAPDIASIMGTKITTYKEGKAIITATQNGNSTFFPTKIIDTIVVKKAIQTIIGFDVFPIKKVGTIPFKILAKSSSGQVINYISSNPLVADVIENEVSIIGPGTCEITASILESDAFLGVNQKQTLTVTALNILKMPLYIVNRDTVIDLNSLKIGSNSIFDFTFISGKYAKAEIVDSLAKITFLNSNKAWVGTDTLWFTAKNKNLASDNIQFGIKIRRTPLSEKIAIVTVDSATGTKSIIAWVRSKNAGIKAYIVYRGGIETGKWDSIGYVTADKASYFVDKYVNVKQQAYQYMLVTVDSNNIRSAQSPIHTTMHLMSGFNNEKQIQLWWSPYVGTDVKSYIIYRLNQTTGVYDSIGSSSLVSFTDTYTPTGKLSYKVGIRFGKIIKTDNFKSDNGPFSQSLSNMAESELVGTDILTKENVYVYPNPASTEITIALPKTDNYDIEIYDYLGQLQFKEKVVLNDKIVLPVSQLSNAVYSVKIKGLDSNIVLQFVKD